MYVYIYIYIGAEDCTPEIDISEIIADFQRHVAKDVQWYFPTIVHLAVVCSKGLTLSQWTLTGKSNGISVAFSNGISPL